MLKLFSIILCLATPMLVRGQVNSYADTVDKAAPAVVSIQTSKQIKVKDHPVAQDPYYKFFFGEKDLQNNLANSKMLEQGLGSGVLISEQGYVLTNHHVIDDVSEIIVKLSDGRVSKAQIIGLDPETDLAVLKITLSNLPTIALGDSDKVRVGDIVLAIGNPFGFSNTVTQGIISAKGDNRGTQQDFFNALIDNLLQTDAAINPGNSGGGLIDLNGRLIGINTAIFSTSGGSHGIGFAIPINNAIQIMQQLITHGKILRGWLGVRLNELSPEMRQYLGYHELHGIYVQATVKNSPAQKAGILPGDVLVSLNHQALNNVTATLRLIANLQAQQACSLKVFRKGKLHLYQVVVENKNPR